MGGTVAETIRRENGEVIKMARKTGAYNWMLQSKEFNIGEVDKAIDDHIAIFMEMKTDYENGKPYKHPMSGVYGWCNHMAPVDYGLVVLDFKNKKIHSMQGYDTPGGIYSVSMNMRIQTDTEATENYKFLVNNNLFDVYDQNKNYLGDMHSIFGSKDTFNVLQEEIKRSFREERSLIPNIFAFFQTRKINATDLIFFPKGLKDFEIIDYPEDPSGLINMLSALKSDGFEFNSEEVKMWKEFYDEPDMIVGYDNKFNQEEVDNMSDDEYEKYQEECVNNYQLDIDKIFNSKKPTNKP